MLTYLNGLLGLIVILGIAFLVSNNKRMINWRLVGLGVFIQIIFAVFILKGEQLATFFAPFGWPKIAFGYVAHMFVVLLSFTMEGAMFLFGDLAKTSGQEGSLGFFFAFQVLPMVIFFSSLMSVLYFLGIMKLLVQGVAWVMLRIMGTSGAESLSAAGNIFVGQTESPLMIRPFIAALTMSELLAVMVGGMATIAGSVLAAYLHMLGSSFAEVNNMELLVAEQIFAEHLLGASIMAAPAALVLAKMMWPETGEPVTKGTVSMKIEKTASNVIEAAAEGASNGLKLAANIGAMLLAFVALIAMVNYGLGKFGGLIGVNDNLIARYGSPLTLELMFGVVLQYLGVAIGIPWKEAFHFGSLLGTKVVLNEFVAYIQFADMIRDGRIVMDKTIFMTTFALCGFANFSSIAIQIGGLSPMAPNRRRDIAKLGLRAVLGGTLAGLMTATVAGVLLG